MNLKLLLSFLLLTTLSYAQVGIGTTTPNGQLDVTSTDNGFLLPRVALTGTTDATTVLTLTESELVYNTATVSDVTPGYYYWDGTSTWIRINPKESDDWTLTGNAGTSPGTWAAPGTNFVGTTDAQDFFIRTNNQNRFRVTTDGLFQFGVDATSAPSWATMYVESLETKTNNYAGFYNNYRTSSSGAQYSIYNYSTNINASSSGKRVGIGNFIRGEGSGTKVGLINSITGGTTGSGQGLTGVENLLTIKTTNTTDITHGGLINSVEFNSSARGKFYGVYNGVETQSGGVHSKNIVGVYNYFDINTGGDTYGSHTYYDLSSSGTGDKYGSYTYINSGIPGTHYGLYTDVQGASNYAGYFLGRISIGTAFGNEYILPASRGTNGQVMVTDGSGNVSWVSPTHALRSENPNKKPIKVTNNDGIYNVSITDYTVRVLNGITGVQLPSAIENKGQLYVIIGTNDISAKPLTTLGGSVFDDVTNSTITEISSNSRIMIQSDGTDWIVIGN